MGMALAGVGGAAASATVLLYDTFPDANGTALPADAAGIWTAVIGTFYTQSGTAQPNSDADGNQVTADATHSDYTLTCDVTPGYSDTSNTERPGVLFRWTDQNNFFFVDVAADVSAINLYDVESGIFINRGSSTQTVASGSTHAVKVVLSGTSITVYWDGTSIISYTSSFNQTATKAGLRLGKLGTSAKCKWDNFKVTT